MRYMTIADVRDIARVKDCNGRHTEFRHLLSQYAIWSRIGLDNPKYVTFLGIKGGEGEIAEGKRNVLYITDEIGLFIYNKVSIVRFHDELGYKLFKEIYINNYNIEDLTSLSYMRKAFKNEGFYLEDRIASHLLQIFIEKIRQKCI